MRKLTTIEEIKSELESIVQAYNVVTECIGTDGITEEGKAKMDAIKQLRWYTTFSESIKDLYEYVENDKQDLKDDGIYVWSEKWLRFNVGM